MLIVVCTRFAPIRTRYRELSVVQGLLNIHQQLRSVLRHGKEKAAPKDFKLRFGRHTLTGSTWESVQRSCDTEVLAIWMDTPELPAISVQDADSNTITEQEGAQNSAAESLHETTRAKTATNPTYPKLEPTPYTPFLEWLVLDDFGNRDESTPEVKADRFLSAIYRSLTADCAPQSTAAAPQAAQTLRTGQIPMQGYPALTDQTAFGSQDPQPRQRPPTEQPSQPNQTPWAPQIPVTQADGTGRQNIKVVGKTAKDVDDLTYRLRQQADENETMIELQLRTESKEFFAYYMPATHNELLDPVRIFWGLVYELIVSSLLFGLIIFGAEAFIRSIVSVCNFFATNFITSTYGPNDFTLESIAKLALSTTLEQ